MRLDFNVLWVDDQQANVDADAEKFERLIRKDGFRLKKRLATSVSEAAQHVSEEIYRDSVDLILMDYHLDGGPNGDQGLIEVRKQLPYRDIVFYSSAANQLREIVLKAQVEGVYCSTRTELPETAHEVFQSLIKKSIDIDHSRGIVMGATSDIDHSINECLVRCFDLDNEDFKAAILKAVLDRMVEIRSRFGDSAGKVEGIKHVAELLDHHHIYTSADRANLLRQALKQSGRDGGKDPLKKYISEIGPKRNILAHTRVQVDGFERKLLDRKGNELSAGDMRNLRIELLELQEALDALQTSLN